MEQFTSKPDPGGGTGAQFPATHWSLILAAAGQPSADVSGAMEMLGRTYWPPIYAFLRRQGYAPHDAQDLTQEFFARLLRKKSFASADPHKGRFRTYLLGALKHFLADERDKARAEKRGGNIEFISLDETRNAERLYDAELSAAEMPEKIFDRRWGLTLLEQAIGKLKAEFAASDKTRQFELLKAFLTSDAGPGGYDGVAAQLDTTPGSIAVSEHRLRQRFRELVRAEVAQTVASPADVDEELRALFS